jgi:hypothetical protein
MLENDGGSLTRSTDFIWGNPLIPQKYTRPYDQEDAKTH